MFETGILNQQPFVAMMAPKVIFMRDEIFDHCFSHAVRVVRPLRSCPPRPSAQTIAVKFEGGINVVTTQQKARGPPGVAG
jgi:hypothetical protein